MFQLLTRILEATAWKMPPIRPYGPFHLCFTVFGFLLCACAAWHLRNISDRGNRLLLSVVGGFLAVCEVYKQLFYIFVLGDGSYPWHIFPFQLCSIPMYLCLLAPSLKNETIRTTMYTFMMSFNLMGGGISFFEPSGIITDYWTLTLHAHIWHMMLVFIGLYLGFSHRASTRNRYFRLACVMFCVLCLMALLLNTAVIRFTGQGINMFFVGPENSPLVVFSTIAERFGWYFSTALYVPAASLGAYLVFLPFQLAQNRHEQACFVPVHT